MAETLTGKLEVRKVKSGDQVILSVPTKKGSQPMPVSNELSPDLKAQPAASLNGVEVDFDLEGGQAKRVRPKGAAWSAPLPPPRAPAQASPRGRGSQPGRSPQTFRAPAGPAAAVVGDFFNPYNFVPAPPRKDVKNELGDHLPAGHHRWRSERWSGTIRVQLTTITPLLIPDAARATTDEKGHKTMPTRSDAKGRPYLAPTSIKGMLRSAFEMVTNSRFGIFAGHKERLGLRLPASQGLSVVPARVEADPSGSLCLQILPGTARLDADGRPNGPMTAAWLRSYVDPHRKNWGALGEHSSEVWAGLSLWEHDQPRFTFWNVEELVAANQPQPSAAVKNDRTPWRKADRIAPKQERWVKGYVCRTDQNIDPKHDERVFFIEPGHPQAAKLRIPVGDAERRSWSNLIRDYQVIHDDEIRQGQKGPSASRRARWSRHIRGGAAERELSAGTLCYATLQGDGRGGFTITGLFPVMISRQLFVLSPDALLCDSLKPATKLDALSPADRVFGWVNGNGKGAYRGQLRVGAVHCDHDDALETFPGLGMPLAILGQPKTQQARFYAAADKSGRPLQGVEKVRGYQNKDQGLRGRKVYLHHAGLPVGHWENPAADRTQSPNDGRYQEYRRPRDSKGVERDNQNRSITSWVKPGVSFSFDLEVSNLSDVELGALLWLLQLPEEHHLRLGTGKPLGFGSARLALLHGGDLRAGSAWKQHYRSLVSPSPSRAPADAVDQAVSAFKAAIKEAYKADFDNVPFIAAFKAAAKGASKPIHYPRLTAAPNPEGENFKWFVENEGAHGRKLGLGALWLGDPGLPLDPTR